MVDQYLNMVLLRLYNQNALSFSMGETMTIDRGSIVWENEKTVLQVELLLNNKKSLGKKPEDYYLIVGGRG